MHTTDFIRAPVLATALAAALSATLAPAHALPGARDRVYTADQNSNTVSVIDPSTNTLLGQIRLGNQRPDVLSPLYKGEVNVHGMGFSPDHKTLIAIASVLLAIPIIALLWVGSYARETPKLVGFPFFFWYQFLWVFLCSGLTYAAYRLTLSARGKTTHKVGVDR